MTNTLTLESMTRGQLDAAVNAGRITVGAWLREVNRRNTGK